MLTLHNLKKSSSPRSRKNWFGRRDPILSMNSSHKQSRSTIHSMIWTIAKRKGSWETPLEGTHKLAITNQMIDNQPNHITKGTKIPTAHNLWSWMPPSSNSSKNHYLIKKKNNNNKNNSVSDVEDQDTYWRIANRGMEGHNNSSETCLTAMGMCRSTLPKIEEHMIPPEQWRQPS